MCVCQKLLWEVDYNHPNAAEPIDNICVRWKNEKHLKDDECLAACIVVGQYIDGAAGRDPYVCHRARDALRDMKKYLPK